MSDQGGVNPYAKSWQAWRERTGSKLTDQEIARECISKEVMWGNGDKYWSIDPSNPDTFIDK